MSIDLDKISGFQIDLENVLEIPSGIEKVQKFSKKVDSISERIHGKALENPDDALDSVKSFLSEQGFDWDGIAQKNETVGAVQQLVSGEGLSAASLEGGVKSAAKKSSKLLFKTFKTMIEGKATKSVGGQIVPMKFSEFIEEMQSEFRSAVAEIPILGEIFSTAWDAAAWIVESYRPPPGTVVIEGQKGNVKDFCQKWTGFQVLGETDFYDYPKMRKTIFTDPEGVHSQRDLYRFRAPWVCGVDGRRQMDRWLMLTDGDALARNSERKEKTAPAYQYALSKRLIGDDAFWGETEGMRFISERWLSNDQDLFNTGLTGADIPLWMPLWFPGVAETLVAGARLNMLLRDDWEAIATMNPMTGIAPIGTSIKSLSKPDKQAYIYNSIVIAVARFALTHKWHKLGRALTEIQRVATEEGVKTDYGLDFATGLGMAFKSTNSLPGDLTVYYDASIDKGRTDINASGAREHPTDRYRIAWDIEKLEAALSRLAYSGSYREVRSAFESYRQRGKGGGGGVLLALAAAAAAGLWWKNRKKKEKKR